MTNFKSRNKAGTLVFLFLTSTIFILLTLFAYTSENKTRSLEKKLFERESKSAQFLAEAIRLDMLQGNFRYAWKQLNTLFEEGHISCFSLLSRGDTPLVVDAEMNEKCKFQIDHSSADLAMLEEKNWRSYYQRRTDEISFKYNYSDFFSDETGSKLVIKISKSGIKDTISSSRKDTLSICILVTLFAVITGLIARYVVVISLKQIEHKIKNVANSSSDTPNNIHSSKLEQFFGLSEAMSGLHLKLNSLKNELESKSALAAIARTTQALAHDVRKPFSMFRMIIDAVTEAEDPSEVKHFLQESLPEVMQAMASVDGMIADVLEVGGHSTPVREPTGPEALIETTLNEIFRVYPDAHVDVIYDLKHRHKILVDSMKVARVFSNIVSNALQAMNYVGRIFFSTSEIIEDGNTFVQFTIANEKSFIPQESIPKLFEAFFTSGKKGGTGLGLAIAHKIVSAHGGKIWCTSVKTDEYPQGKVAFYFTLPVSSELCIPRQESLPQSSADVVAVFEKLRHSTLPNQKMDSQEWELESRIIKGSTTNQKVVKILIVDDENVYRNSLASLATKSNSLKGALMLRLTANSKEAIQAVDEMSPDIVILDVDLGLEVEDGYEITRDLRATGYSGIICIHSNRTLPQDFKQALESGADIVLPKPMSRAHLLKLVAEVILKA
jgi:signal transduction histidine kinase